MNESTFNLFNCFEFVLKRFPNIMCNTKGHVRMQNNIQLDHKIVSIVVSPDSVNSNNIRMVIACNKSQCLQQFRRCCLSSQTTQLRVTSASPNKHQIQRDENSTQGINPPSHMITKE